MRYLFFFLLTFCNLAWGQLINTVELSEKLDVTQESEARKMLLHLASFKSIEKFAPELGYKFEDFSQKLNDQFNASFKTYKENKLKEKFGANYQETLSDADEATILNSLDKERDNAFIKFSRSLDVLRSHTFSSILHDEKDSSTWKAKVEVDLDKAKLERLLRRVTSGERKPFSKLILISEIDPLQFTWADLGLGSESDFLSPINAAWLKWLNENIPSTVEEVVGCDADCMVFYRKWMETHVDQVSLPEEYANAVILKVSLHLRRVSVFEALKEVTFEWEGRALIQDMKTKKFMESFTLPLEKRAIRQTDQKALNSNLASSLYRAPMTAFMQFNRKLEEKMGINRVSKLVIQGHKHLGDVHALMDVIKTRGSSLGLEPYLDSFSREEATLNCYYRGEEKSFTDLLSGIKELKSSYSYTLVNEFTGVHFLIKMVTE